MRSTLPIGCRAAAAAASPPSRCRRRRDAGRDQQRAVGRLNHAAADALGVEEGLDVLEPGAVVGEPGARDLQDAGEPRRLGRVGALRQRGVVEVERAVLREVPVRQDLEQTLRAAPVDRRQPRQRRRRLAVLADDADAAGSLADDDPAVGQEVEGEGAGSVRSRPFPPRSSRCAPGAAHGSGRPTAGSARSRPVRRCRPRRCSRPAAARAAAESRGPVRRGVRPGRRSEQATATKTTNTLDNGMESSGAQKT